MGRETRKGERKHFSGRTCTLCSFFSLPMRIKKNLVLGQIYGLVVYSSQIFIQLESLETRYIELKTDFVARYAFQFLGFSILQLWTRLINRLMSLKSLSRSVI